MISKRGKDRTLDTGVDETQTKMVAASATTVDAAAVATMEKLLHRLQKMLAVIVRLPLESTCSLVAETSGTRFN